MNIHGIGTDIVECLRIAQMIERHGEQFINRVYSDHEIDVIHRIKELLYEEGYTIAGAKKKLEGELEADSSPAAAKKGRKKARPAPAAAEEPAAGDPKQVERLRLGVEGALRQAREILEALESGASS